MNGMNEFERGSQAYQTNGTNMPQKSGLATAALILGIIALCIALIPILNLFFLWFGLLPLIFGIVALVKTESKGKAIAAIVSGVLSFVLAIAVCVIAFVVIESYDEPAYNKPAYNESEREPTWEDYAEVSIGRFEVIEKEYSTDTKVTVRVKNKSSEIRSFYVKVEAVDKNGDRIDTDTIYVSDLGAGQGQKFDIFKYVSSEDLNKMKNATFRVVDVTVY
ncbi:MAG: DUF4190 domain-containing protein [Ruminococcaceae bacterium]|nr:DUF4190 domain-containing protein [Oscillospiraceae bacterium]